MKFHCVSFQILLRVPHIFYNAPLLLPAPLFQLSTPMLHVLFELHDFVDRSVYLSKFKIIKLEYVTN